MALQYTYSASGAIAINTDVVPAQDVKAQSSVELRVLSLGTSGVLTVQASEDGTAYTTVNVVNSAGAIVSTINAAGVYMCPVYTTFIRVRLTTAVPAGRTNIAARVSTSPFQYPVPIPATQPVSGAVSATISATLATGPTLLYHRLVSSAASTNATLVKNTAGRVLKIRGYTAKTAVCYLKLYNKVTAPTVGTDVPVLTFPLKASDVFDIDIPVIGLNFSTGIAYAITGAVADADTTALVAADVVGLSIIYV